MSDNKYYTGIDWMRLIAAVLVITIHTSPLMVTVLMKSPPALKKTV